MIILKIKLEKMDQFPDNATGGIKAISSGQLLLLYV